MNEPLLKRDIWKYIQYARENGFINIFFSTNGILLTEKNIRNIIESGVTKIFVSLDAFTKETYTKLRGYSGFEIIQQNILNFLQIRKELNLTYPLIRINFLKNKENISELDSFISFWQNKADMINIQEMNELLGTKSELYIEKQAEYRCSMPFKQLVINSWGDILPCCTMHGIQHKIGNVRDTSLQVAWNSPKINYLRDLHKNGRIKENVICKTCIYG
jgi:radical SAM protein with 4Fe4S-binding SPASM domain